VDGIVNLLSAGLLFWNQTINCFKIKQQNQMNREIKFRAWNKEENEMCISTSHLESWFNQPHYIPLQYTGLKDKNGKEIYEGDIVKLWFDEGEEVFWNSFLVKFFEGCFICEFLQGDTEEYPIFEYWNDSKDLEIIGNIYENPELLTNN
jgi:hypothetical protein